MEHQAEQVQKMKVDVEMRDKILQDLYAWEEKMREEDAQYKLSRNSQIHSIDVRIIMILFVWFVFLFWPSGIAWIE